MESITIEPPRRVNYTPNNLISDEDLLEKFKQKAKTKIATKSPPPNKTAHQKVDADQARLEEAEEELIRREKMQEIQ